MTEMSSLQDRLERVEASVRVHMTQRVMILAFTTLLY